MARMKWTHDSENFRCHARIADRQCEYEATTETERYGVKIKLCATHDRAFHKNQIGKRYGTA